MGARGEHNVVISCNMKLNLDYLVEVLWEELKLIRIYTKKPGHPPDFEDGIIFRSGITVKNVCDGIHRTLAADFKYALAWGRSTKFSPQRVGTDPQDGGRRCDNDCQEVTSIKLT